MANGDDLSALENLKVSHPLMPGSPGVETLKDCTAILKAAADDVLREDADVADLFMYGATGGDPECLQELAKLLTNEYGDHVSSTELTLTAAATQGLHMVLTLMFGQDSPVFVEDPSYFYGYRIIRDDLKRNLIPVPFDDDGMIPEELDRLLNQYRLNAKRDPHADLDPTDVSKSYWASVYMMPVFHNPCGMSYSEDRCKELVHVARKHNILLIAEDVYNLIHFEEGLHAPKRLLSYDKETADERSRGHVLSIGTFSKILAPSLRIGWIEGPSSIISFFNSSNYSNSGGSFNHFMSKLVCSVLKSGVLPSHLVNLRAVYKTRMSALTETLSLHLPEGCSFVVPKGGFFLWLKFRKEINSGLFLKFLIEEYGVNFLPGVHCSPSGGFGHCARLSISYAEEAVVRQGALRLCEALERFMA